MKKIGICIPTYKKKEWLLSLLKSISNQRVKNGDKYIITIFIVDNDEKGSAKEILTIIEKEYPYAIKYEIECRVGIPFVRNRLVSMTIKEDIIIFVDDDEEVSEDWLYEMIKCYEEAISDVVTGPVLGKISDNAPVWARNGKFYDSDRYDDKKEINYFYTNNTLINRRILDEISNPFDESMALSGGTDLLLSMKLKELGYRYVWCDKAIVYEEIPKDRLTLSWYFKRRYRIGNALIYCRYNLNKKISYHIEYLKVIKLILLSIIVFISGVLYGSHKYVKGIGYLCQALGSISALFFDVKYNEYSRDKYRTK